MQSSDHLPGSTRSDITSHQRKENKNPSSMTQNRTFNKAIDPARREGSMDLHPGVRLKQTFSVSTFIFVFGTSEGSGFSAFYPSDFPCCRLTG